MAQLSHGQQVWRDRIESGLRFAAPFLDVLLAAGDQLSRLTSNDDAEVDAVGAAPASKRRAITDGRA